MAIPDYQKTMRPFLDVVSNGQIHHFHDICEQLYQAFALTPEEIQRRIPSGRQTYIRNRLGWARTYLKKAGLITAPGRLQVQITERGLSALKECQDSISVNYLKQFPEFQAFYYREEPTTQSNNVTSTVEEEDTTTPEEKIENAYASLRATLASDLLDAIKAQSPTFFEKLVVDLMLKIGYGGSRKEAGRATQQSADGGIDGVIHEDRLGLDTIYLQAKRWENTVGRPEIQKFAGALQGEGATKGVFITTSDYSSGAREYAERVNSRIVLIDGHQLAQLMIDSGLGVSTREVYEIKAIDSDYFSDN